MTKNVKYVECRFATHIPASKAGEPDTHVIKEQITYEDGTRVPNLRRVKGFKRSFYVTSASKRTHQQKKEWEDLNNLMRFECQQDQLKDALAKSLGQQFSNSTIKQLSASPYLYGSDITSTAIIKQMYRKKYPDIQTLYTVAAFDTESDILNTIYLIRDINTQRLLHEIDDLDELAYKLQTTKDTLLAFVDVPRERIQQQISTVSKLRTISNKAISYLKKHSITSYHETIIATLTMADKFLIVAQQSYLKGISNPESAFKATMAKYLHSYVSKRQLKIELLIAKDELDVFRQAFRYAHEWMPDFLAIWNVRYDMGQILTACERQKVNPKYLLSDPSLPNNEKYFKWLPGQTKKVTASGKVIPINPAAQWHVCITPASFFIIDAMCSYKHIRLGGGEEPSYSLDAILNKVLGERKLRFEEANEYTGLKWHQFMQKNYKLEYMAYAAFDVIGMLELDEKTKDLSLTLPTFSGISDFSIFNSQPKRIADMMHFFCLERNKVISAVGRLQDHDDDEEDEIDLSGWIVTLSADMTTQAGLCCITEDPSLKTTIRGFVFDLDCLASYPSDTLALNISKETTFSELLEVEGISREVAMLQNINLISGHVNAVEYCQTMLGFPNAVELLKDFKAQT